MKENRTWIVFGFLVLLMFPSIAYSDSSSTELALFEEIPMVITPGKKLQPITEAPTSVYVVTQEDIKQSGSINLWDVLREVPGMDVSTTTIGQPDVSMRGFNNPLANKTLLLVDGRSVYLPLQGFLLWEMMPVQLEEIDRIEVVKGPVASLYGANANTGLINIITKKPEQMKGNLLSSTGGTRNTQRHSYMYGGNHDNLSYKLSTGMKTADSFNNERSRNALDVVQGNSYMEYKIDDDSKVALSGGIAQGSFYQDIYNQYNTSNVFFGTNDMTMTYMQANYDRGGFSSRIFWNYFKSLYQSALLDEKSGIDTVEGELRYAFDLNEQNNMIVGAGARSDNVYSGFLSQTDGYRHRQGIWDIFAQDDYKISEKFRLNGSLRLDHYELTGLNPSARVAGMFYPNENDVYRLSVGYSFRSPTTSENYLDLTAFLGGGASLTTRGDKSLDPEKYLTYEFNYQGKRMDGRLRPFADFYITRIEDIIEAYKTGGGPVGLDGSFRNFGDAYSAGGELGAEYDISKHWTLINNYAYNNVDYYSSDVYVSPHLKINSGVKFRAMDNRLTAKLLSHYVSAARTTKEDAGKVPAYVQGTLWVGYKIKEDVEVSVAGYNIFFDKHIEQVGGDDIGTRVLGNITLKF
jgi:iron complex outermembrane receptor protein